MRCMPVRIVFVGMVLLWAAAALPCESPQTASRPAAIISSSAPAAGARFEAPGGGLNRDRGSVGEGIPVRQGDPVREIDDPNTGWRWLLYRDPARPGGPGRLVPLTPGPLAGYGTSGAAESGSALPPVQLVVRSGDRVTLEESTAVVESRLESVALGPAVSGGRLRVRLRLGGAVIEAVALGPGRVAAAPRRESAR